LEDLLREYVEYLKYVRRASDHTIMAYGIDVSQFLKSLKERKLNLKLSV